MSLTVLQQSLEGIPVTSPFSKKTYSGTQVVNNGNSSQNISPIQEARDSGTTISQSTDPRTRGSVSLPAAGTVANLAEQFHSYKETRAKRSSRVSLRLLQQQPTDKP